MKKLFVLLCTVALLGFASMAFAADAGHLSPEYDPVAPAVVVPGASGDVVVVPVPAAEAVAVADHFAAVDQFVGFVDAVYETFHFSFSSQVSQCTTTRCTSTKGQQPMYR